MFWLSLILEWAASKPLIDLGAAVYWHAAIALGAKPVAVLSHVLSCTLSDTYANGLCSC